MDKDAEKDIQDLKPFTSKNDLEWWKEVLSLTHRHIRDTN